MSSISIQIMYSYPDHRKQLHKTSAAIPSNAQLNLLLYGFSVWFPVLMPAACKQTLGAHDWALPHQHLKLGAVFLETHQLTVASTDQLTVASTGKSLLPSRWTQTLVLVPRDCKTTKTPHSWSFEAFSISATIRASFKRSGLSSSVAGSHQMRTSPTNSLISDTLEGKPTVIQGLSIWPPFVKRSGANLANLDPRSKQLLHGTGICPFAYKAINNPSSAKTCFFQLFDRKIWNHKSEIISTPPLSPARPAIKALRTRASAKFCFTHCGPM